MIVTAHPAIMRTIRRLCAIKSPKTSHDSVGDATPCHELCFIEQANSRCIDQQNSSPTTYYCYTIITRLLTTATTPKLRTLTRLIVLLMVAVLVVLRSDATRAATSVSAPNAPNNVHKRKPLTAFSRQTRSKSKLTKDPPSAKSTAPPETPKVTRARERSR